MKITMEIPDETILVTASLVAQTKSRTISLGVFPICSNDLKDGNTVDFKSPYDKQKQLTEKGGE